MNTLPNITAKENISKPIILNKFSIKNIILNSINLSINNFSDDTKNCRNTQSKILCVTPENQSKIIRKTFANLIQNIRFDKKKNNFEPIKSKFRNTIDYIKVNTKSPEKNKTYFEVIPKFINISLRCPCNSERKSPRDSVKKIRQSNYNNEIGITPKKTFFNNSSPKSIVLRFPKKNRQITNILTIKKITKLDKISLLDKLEKYPKDSRSPKNYENPKRLILKEFIYGKQIGKGTFGKIFSVKWIKNNKNYCLKEERLKDEYDFQNRKKVYRIIQNFITKTGSKNIIHLYCILCYKKKSINNDNINQNQNIKNENYHYEYYELMEKAEKDWEEEISERKQTDKYYTEKELFNIIFQLVSVLSLLEKYNITHRDIKPQNILILNGNYKLCDFNELKELEMDGLIIQRVRGSELYMSPILFYGLHNNIYKVRHNTYKSDVFSLGMCLFYAASLTYGGVDSIRELIDMNEIKKIIYDYLGNRYSEKLIFLILNMLEIDEIKRPNFIQLEKIVKKYYSS